MKTIKSSMIAPCGMNCGICYARLREKNTCQGCNNDDINEPAYCVRCRIKNCKELTKNKSGYCFTCERYPCARLKQLDKRYRTKYGMSMIENLENIRANGIRVFVKAERARWTCSRCGGVICVHKGCCSNCGEAHKNKYNNPLDS